MEAKFFFIFGSKLVGSNVQVPAVDLKTDKNGISEHWKLIKGQYDGINFPVIFKHEYGYGKKFNDILDTGWPNLFLISDRLKTVLEENKLTGWQTFPIKLYDTKGTEIFGYHGFSIIGHSGPTNYERSEIIEKRRIPTGPICHYYKGVSIDKWDGTDFFTPDKTYHIFITKRAADILKENKITNMRLENLAEKETDISDVKKDSD